jgi:hypothetical protein
MKYSYKGLAMVVDNVRQYNGRFPKGLSRGSLWVGPVLEPLKIMDNNFWVLSTDYETYAITYSCTSQTVMWNQDHVTIYTKESPGFGIIDRATEEIIRSEFNRIFGTNEAIAL